MSTKASLMRTVKRHGNDTLCRHCRQSINTTPLRDLLYTFEPCDCPVASYTHLVETVYHRRCFALFEKEFPT